MIPSARVVRAGLYLTRSLPMGVSRALARAAGFLAPWMARARFETLLTNAQHLSPELAGPAQLQQARRTFVNFFDAAVDVLRSPSLSAAELRELVEIQGLEQLSPSPDGTGIVIVAGHMGPYELAAAAVAARGVELHALAEDLDPETNAAMSQYREATGLKLLSRNSGLRQMYRVLRSGGTVALVADRVVGGAVGGNMPTDSVEVAFGNGRRLVPTGPAAFALASGARVVIGYVVRHEKKGSRDAQGARYHLVLEPHPVDASATTEQLTVSIAARLAALTRQFPDQWYVFQPDWR